MYRGYIALWRKIEDHPFYKEPRVFSKYEAWIDILKEAQHNREPQEVVFGMNVLICHYGECLKSNVTWAKKWGWSEHKVRVFMKLLEKMGQIRRENVVITSRITIINFESYDPRCRTSVEQPSSSRRGSVEGRSTDNNDNNVNNDNNISSPVSNSQNYTSEFLEFWKIYPRKESKGQALKAWKKIKEPKATLGKIKSALAWQINSEQWTDKNGKYIPYPATYLNARKWEDEQTVDPKKDWI